jgi:hypothetical protein
MRALKDFGAPPGFSEKDFTTPGTVVQFGEAPLRVDILMDITGVPDFDRAWEARTLAATDRVPVPLIGIDDLIANKAAIGDPRRKNDGRDLKALLKTRERLEKPPRLAKARPGKLERLPDSRPRPPTIGGLCDWPEGQQVGVVVRALDIASGTAKIEYRGRDGAVLRSVPLANLTNCRGAPRPPSTPTKPRKFGERPAWLKRSPKVERLPHDYNPEWDFTLDKRAPKQVKETVVRRMTHVQDYLEALGVGHATVHFVVGFQDDRGHVARYINGTSSAPVFVFNARAHVNAASDEVEVSLLHEAGHAYFDSRGLSGEDPEGEEAAVEEAARWLVERPGDFGLARKFLDRLARKLDSGTEQLPSGTMEACPYVPGTDPVEYIRADHTEIRGLLSEVARVLPTDPPRARKLLRQARLDIEQHLVSEEDEVFPLWEREHPEYAAELHGFIHEHPGLLANICALEQRLTLPGLLKFMAKVSDHSQREDRVFGIDGGTRAGYEERMRSRPRNRPAVKKAHRLGPEVVLLTKRGGAHQNRPRDVATGRAKPKHKKPLDE